MKRIRHLLENCSLAGALVIRVINAVWRRARKPQFSGLPRRILIVKLDAIGDFILASPFLRELKRSFPSAFITLVVSPTSASLAEGCPYANVTLVFTPEAYGLVTKPGRVLAALLFARRLQAAQFDLAIIPRWDHDFYMGYHIACGSRAKRIIGYTRALAFQPNSWLSKSERRGAVVLSHETPEHEVLRNLRLLEAADGSVHSDDLEVWLSAEDRRRAVVWLERHVPHDGLDCERLVAFGIGATVAPKRWPEDRFAELSRHLVSEFGVRVVLVGGGDNDIRIADTILRLAQNPAVFNAVGQFNLRETAALLERCELFVGNDSGPMHLAAAVSIPVVEICGLPLDQPMVHGNSPTRFGPWKVPSIVVRPRSETVRRKHRTPTGAPLRIDSIPVDEVAKAAATFLCNANDRIRRQNNRVAREQPKTQTVLTKASEASIY